MLKEEVLQNIRIVLVKTTHPGNIGATARAMKTMGLSDLALVGACDHLSSEALARSSGAEDILQQARLFNELPAAIADCAVVAGSSARVRNLPWAAREPAQLAAELIPICQQRTVALVFGRERDGLNNEELQCCHFHVTIPTSAHYRSLNLAQAVQLLVYECRKAWLAAAPREQQRQEEVRITADSGKLHGFLEHLNTLMQEVEFLDPKQPKLLSQRVRRLFMRAGLDETEINIMRGLLSAVQKKLAAQK